MKELVAEFRKYPESHPFRVNLDKLYDENGGIIPERISEHWMELNTYNMIGQTLKCLQDVSEAGYKNMINDKLKAKDGQGINWHNLLSALCELAVMYSFILSSNHPDSFVYEDKLRKDNQKDVDFSITINNILFHVEIKSGNMLKQQMEEGKALKDSQVVIADQRAIPIGILSEVMPDVTLLGSLDNKIKDFITDSMKKFNGEKGPHERNVLYICWDENIFQPCTALLSEHYSLLKEMQPDAIDYIIVSDLYRQIESIFSGYRHSVPGASPFFLRFSNHKIIDNGFDRDDKAFKILCNVTNGMDIADEDYIKTCPEIRFTF